MPEYAHCPVCLGDIESHYRNEDVSIVCPRCGEFEMSRTLASSDVGLYGERWILSGAIRNAYERNGRVSLDSQNILTLLKTARPPNGPIDSIHLLLEHIHARMESPSDAVPFKKEHDYPLVYAKNQADFEFYISKAHQLDLIEPYNKQDGPPDRWGSVQQIVCWRLTIEGWNKILELSSQKANPDRAFVAMWFNPDLVNIYEKGIVPALKANKYDPVRVDYIHFNDKIDDRIIAEIRRSGLLIADFTGHRGGVYFEAGFALGLGIDVIFTCRADDIENAHFDTRQYNHITWKDTNDLYTQLNNRLAAMPNF